jgi:hypothetical protein
MIFGTCFDVRITGLFVLLDSPTSLPISFLSLVLSYVLLSCLWFDAVSTSVLFDLFTFRVLSCLFLSACWQMGLHIVCSLPKIIFITRSWYILSWFSMVFCFPFLLLFFFFCFSSWSWISCVFVLALCFFHFGLSIGSGVGFAGGVGVGVGIGLGLGSG